MITAIITYGYYCYHVCVKIRVAIHPVLMFVTIRLLLDCWYYPLFLIILTLLSDTHTHTLVNTVLPVC